MELDKLLWIDKEAEGRKKDGKSQRKMINKKEKERKSHFCLKREEKIEIKMRKKKKHGLKSYFVPFILYI